MTAWDIRRKRDSGGSLLTFAGFTGRIKSCRNRANLSVWDNTSPPAIDSTGTVPDFFDTIDDYNNNLMGLPDDVPEWGALGVSGVHGDDYVCGGIFSTGDQTSGATGADSGLNHDPDGNWQDLTPGTVPGGAQSVDPSPGCNASDKFCVFRELTSGLLVTEVSATTYSWQDAVTYCSSLGEAGGVQTSPIPILDVGLGSVPSDWRLPTQKELALLSVAGIRGLNQTANLVSSMGDVDNPFWTSTTRSVGSADAWVVNLRNGYVDITAKTALRHEVCIQ